VKKGWRLEGKKGGREGQPDGGREERNRKIRKGGREGERKETGWKEQRNELKNKEVKTRGNAEE
jgi:hypothetical protein